MTRLVYVSPVPWNSMPQRPHFFVEQALRNGVSRVLWVEPTPSRLPGLRDLRRGHRSSREPDNQLIDTRIISMSAGLLPVEPVPILSSLLNAPGVQAALQRIRSFAEGPTLLVIGKPTRLALALIGESGLWKATAYDAMDNFPAFFKGWTRSHVSRIEARIVSRVDHLLCSASRLQQHFARESLLIRNACSSELKRQMSKIDKPSNPVPVLGFVGTMADWLDWEAVVRLARTFPDCRVVMVGPRKAPSPAGLPDNVSIHPAVGHSEMAALLKSFDYGLIPFKRDDLTECVDPIKYYEYCAAGIGVLTTSFGEMRLRGEATAVWDLERVIDGGRLPDLGNDLSSNAVVWEDRFDEALFARLLT